MAKTEGGGALHEADKHDDDGCLAACPVTTRAHWYALWSHSHCEELVCRQLRAKGFEVFLPKIETWSRRAGVTHRILTPMFPGYLFVREELNAARYADLLKARGLVCVLGGTGKGFADVPDREIDAIQAIVGSHLPAWPHPYLRAGQKVRITSGPLADVEGILVDRLTNKGLLVLSVHLFQRSVAVEVDCTLAVAA